MTDTSLQAASGEGTVVRYRWLVLVIVSLGMFVIELDTTVVNIALPSIQHALKFSGASLQWVINAYLLCFGGFLLLAGRLSDRVGGKRMFLAGILAFGVGSAMNAATPSAAVLVIGRALQGLGGATLMPTTLSTVNTTFTDPTERSRALGVWTAIQTGSVALGLILGGVITSELSWRWIFTINIPIAIVAFLGAVQFVPDLRGKAEDSGFDLVGAVTITAGLGLATYALSNAPAWGWGAGRTVGVLVAAAVLVLGFILIEWRVRRPMVPLRIFRSRSLAVGNAGFLFTSAGMYGMFFFSSLYIQEVLGYSALRSGVALLPLTVGVVVGAGGSQPLMKLLKARMVALIGLAVGVIGALLLTRITVGGAYATEFLPGLCVIAIGLGLAMVPFTVMATSGVPESDAGLASGVYTAASYTGGAIGLAVLSTIAASRTAHLLGGSASPTTHARLVALVSGYHVAFVTAAILLGAAALLVAGWLRQKDVAVIGQSRPADNSPDTTETEDSE
jgi:EmrB/QacA subfamily drug resistance transporter